jgi:AcrR family transcriptional regulator
MTRKTLANQSVARRKPSQDRAQHKVGLILEATQRLLDQGGIDSLTTNAVAEKAGVSIGTVYQYFDGKQAILNALADREIEALAARVLVALRRSPRQPVETLVKMIVSAVLDSYGGRRRVHRILMEHALTRGPGTRLNPLLEAVTTLLTEPAPESQPAGASTIAPADAFVLTHAVAGVMRALIVSPDWTDQRDDVEAALTRLMAAWARGQAV